MQLALGCYFNRATDVLNFGLHGAFSRLDAAGIIK